MRILNKNEEIEIIAQYSDILKNIIVEIFREYIEKDTDILLPEASKEEQEEIYSSIYTEYITHYLQDQKTQEFNRLVEEYGEEEAKRIQELNYESKPKKRKGRRKKVITEEEPNINQEEYKEEEKGEETSLEDFILNLDKDFESEYEY